MKALFLQSDFKGFGPFESAVQTIFSYTPKIIGAILLLIAAWIVANIVRYLAKRALQALKVDERLNTGEEIAGSKMIGTLSDVVYWIVFLCFIPAILGVLGLDGILAPVQGMLANILGFLPNVLAAALIFLLGLLIANIVRHLLTAFLTNIGLNKLAERFELKTFGNKGLAGIIGTIVYAVILLAVLSAALNALKIEAISNPVENIVGKILSAIPNIFGATILIIIAVLVAKVVAGLVKDILTGLGFNLLPKKLGISTLPTEGDRTASAYVGNLVYLIIILFAAIEAAKLLNFELLANTIQQVANFGGRVLVGIIIFAIGMYAAQIAGRLITESGVVSGEKLALVAKVAILFFTGAMALNQMGVADNIVNTAFTLLLGALAVAAAIAFGIGGKDYAANLLKKLSDSFDK
jgi:hypothetical protein